jgi:hypothetical protein
MALAAHRARDLGASGDRRYLPESGRDRSAATGGVGTARAPAKPANEVTTGSDAAKPANSVNPNPNPTAKTLLNKVKAKAEAEAKAKPANADEVTTGFGVELSESEQRSPRLAPPTSFREPFRDAIEIKREYCLGPGISGCKMDDYDGCERQVVDEPPTFPEFDGVSDGVPQVGGAHGNQSDLVRNLFPLRRLQE